MVTISHPKTPLSLNIFSSPTTSSSPLTTPMKLKTLIHTLIFSHFRRLIRALSKAKTIFLELFRDNHHFLCLKPTQKKDKYMKKVLFGSFRLHYNWCSSSHVMPFPSHTIQDIDVHTSSHSITISLGTTTSSSNSNSNSSSRSTIYYDSTWNSIFETDDDQQEEDGTYHDARNGGAFMFDEEEGELARYLQWLEEKGKQENINNNGEGNIGNEIDKLADMFIANCHEKFRLEKIESYRRYQQEMLARSM